jgi:site-specific recombinase XerD
MESLSKLRPHHFQEYRYWRQDYDDLNPVSVQTQFSTLRVFIKWVEDYGAIERGMHKHARVPTPDNTKDTKLETSRANLILNYLSKFEYASYRHTLFAFLWHTSMRISSARAIDLEDFHPSENYVEIRHRPEQDTPLKNKQKGKHPVYLDDRHTTLVQDYIDARRNGVTDDYGREPLFSTNYGRAAVSTLREHIYSLSRPCMYDDGHRPQDRDMEECEAAQTIHDASKCPSSISPHTIRRV